MNLTSQHPIAADSFCCHNVLLVYMGHAAHIVWVCCDMSPYIVLLFLSMYLDMVLCLDWVSEDAWDGQKCKHRANLMFDFWCLYTGCTKARTTLAFDQHVMQLA